MENRINIRDDSLFADVAQAVLKCDYTLVIEFLNPNEDLSGAELVDELKSYAWSTEYRSCKTGLEVIEAIKDAERNIQIRGTPIIHLEAHGMKRHDASLVGGIGYQNDDRVEFLSWHHVWNALRALNVATDFNLIVVAASCYGADIIYGLTQDAQQLGRAIPFMATVGFKSKLSPGDVFESMLEFYGQLSSCKAVQLAVDAANKLLPSEAEMELQWPVKILSSVVGELAESEHDGTGIEAYWQRHVSENPRTPLADKEKLLEHVWSHQRKAVKALLSQWLAFESHPHNKTRFALLLEQSTAK